MDSLSKEAAVIFILAFNPLYIGELFHCYMLDESICHFGGVDLFVAHSIFDGKSC